MMLGVTIDDDEMMFIKIDDDGRDGFLINSISLFLALIHRRQCSGLLKGKNDQLYQILNPSEMNAQELQLVDSTTGLPIMGENYR